MKALKRFLRGYRAVLMSWGVMLIFHANSVPHYDGWKSISFCVVMVMMALCCFELAFIGLKEEK